MATQSVTIGTTLNFGDVQAWVSYSDATAPGATSTNQATSKAEILGAMSSSDPQFGPNSMLASAAANSVTANIQVTLSGKTIAVGSVPMSVQSSDNKHWRGSAVLNGTSIQLNVDWDGSGGTGSYHIWTNLPSGSGPLYNAAPAILNFQLIFGAGSGEHPAGGASQIGGSTNPWTQQTAGSRVRSH
jgi:hypothetical protein